MWTRLLVMVTSGLVLLQIIPGLTTHLEPDADFLNEAITDGFIVDTKRSTKTEKPNGYYNAVITHDSVGTLAKNLDATTELNPEHTNEYPKNESSDVGLRKTQTTMLSPEENVEGSGVFPEWNIELIHTTKESAAEVDTGGSGMFSETPSENQDEDLLFTTTVRNNVGFDISTHVFHSSEKNDESGTGTEAPASNFLRTTSTVSVEEAETAVDKINEVAMEKPVDIISQDPVEKDISRPKTRHNIPDLNISEQVKEGMPGWLLILALCLTFGAIICVFVGIATKDKWYGPTRKCLNTNSTESVKQETYHKASTLPLSEKEVMVLLSAQKGERKETVITLDEVPEKECLM